MILVYIKIKAQELKFKPILVHVPPKIILFATTLWGYQTLGSWIDFRKPSNILKLYSKVCIEEGKILWGEIL